MLMTRPLQLNKDGNLKTIQYGLPRENVLKDVVLKFVLKFVVYMRKSCVCKVWCCSGENILCL